MRPGARLGRVLGHAGGLAAAAAGGALFHALGVPIGWVLGALLGAAIWSNTTGRGGLGRQARRAGQLVLGCATASILTPALLAEMAVALPAMALAALVAILVALGFAPTFARLADVDRKTALLSVLPAGLAEMAGLAQDRGARVEVVTLAHTIRVTALVLTLPVLVGAARQPLPPAEGDLRVTLVCLGLSLVLAWAMNRAGFLNPWIVLPVIVGAALTLAGFRLAALPPWAIVAAQVAIGGSLGARLQVDRFARMPRVLGAALLSTLLLYAGTALVLAPVCWWVYDIDLATFALALAPGGLAEMLAAAKAIGAAVPMVLGFQLLRSLVTNLSAAWLLGRALR